MKISLSNRANIILLNYYMVLVNTRLSISLTIEIYISYYSFILLYLSTFTKHNKFRSILFSSIMLIKLIVSFAIYIGLLVTILSSIEPSPSSSSDANSAVLDTQGNKIQSGVEYYVYVRPDITDDVGGYLTLIDRVCNNGSCPLFIGQQSVVGGSKFSIKFTPFIEGESVVRENSYFKAISKALTLCVQSTAWKVGDQESRRRLIVACDDQALLEGFFRIEKGNLGIYHLVWCPLEVCPNCKLNCSYIGYLIDENGNRLLALDANNSSTLPLIFEKANVVSS